MKNRSSILLMVCFMTIQCKVYHQSNNNHYRDKLDIKLIKKRADDYLLNNTTGFQPIKKGSAIMVLSRKSNETSTLDYSEEDISTGDFYRVTGNKIDGYRKFTFNKRKPEIEIILYYPNGNIKTFARMHSEKYLEKDARLIEYAIGISYLYDEQGKVLKTYDADVTYKFSYNNLIDLISKKYPGSIINSVDAGEYGDGSVLWKVIYYAPSLGLCRMGVNGKNGEIIYDDHNLITIE